VAAEGEGRADAGEEAGAVVAVAARDDVVHGNAFGL
jgi:hypothetical protein